MTASVTTPNGTDPTNLEFQLFAQGGRLVVDKTPDNTGKTTFTGGTMGLSPGTYQLVVFSPSEAKALKPIVISGYDISVTKTKEVDQNSALTVSGTVSETKASQPPASVKVILWNDEYDKRVDANFNQQAFSANISLTDLSPGEYNLYVTANGNKQYQGEDEIKAIKEGESVTITEDTGDGESESESGDGESESESGDGESESGDDESESGDGESESGDGESESESESESGDGEVIEPSSSDGESTTSDSTTTDDRTDLGVPLVVLAILSVTLVLRPQ